MEKETMQRETSWAAASRKKKKRWGGEEVGAREEDKDATMTKRSKLQCRGRGRGEKH